MHNDHLPVTGRKRSKRDSFISVLMVFFFMLTVCFLKTTIAAESKGLPAIKDELKIALVMAAHMPAKDLNKLAQSPAGPSSVDFRNQPLTLLLLTMNLVSRDDLSDDQIKEISYTEGTLDPATLINSMLPTGIYRYFYPAPSVIQLKYIQHLTCTIKGDTATGVVTIAAKPWRMSPHYVARNINGKWKVVEFSLPANQIKTVLGEDGLWKINAVKSKRFPGF